jgi:hypothetical protein
MDWFSVVGMLLIVVVLISLWVYSIRSRPPSPSGIHLPEASSSAE